MFKLISRFEGWFGKLAWVSQTLTRVTVGLVFVWSGWGKLHHLPDVIDFFRSLGIPAPQYQAPFAAGTEFLAGLLVVLGFFTRFAAVPLIVIMIVALKTAKGDDITDLNSLFGLSEYLYIVLLLWLVTQGAGPLSLDRLRGRKN